MSTILSKQEFFKRYYPVIKKVIKEKGSKILPEVAMSQLILENGYKEFTPNSTMFGVKSKTGKGKNLGTTENENGKVVNKDQSFVVSETMEEAVGVYLDNFQTSKKGGKLRYQEALDATTFDDQIKAIADAGYATINEAYTKEDGTKVPYGEYYRRLSKTRESNGDSLGISGASAGGTLDGLIEDGVLGNPPPTGETVINVQNQGVQRNGRTQYKTEWTNPDGKTHELYSFNPTKVEMIGNNSYLFDGKRYKRFGTANDSNDNRLTTKENTYEREFVDLEKKVKSGKHLTEKELQFAENITQIKEDEFQDEIESKKDSGIRQNVLNEKRLKVRERLLKNIVAPESRKFLEENKKRKKEELTRLKEQSLNGSLNSEQLKIANKKYNEANKANKIWNKEAALKEEELNKIDKIGEQTGSSLTYPTSLRTGSNKQQYGGSDQLTIGLEKLKKETADYVLPPEAVSLEDPNRLDDYGRRPLGTRTEAGAEAGTEAVAVTEGAGAEGVAGAGIEEVDPNGLIPTEQVKTELKDYVDKDYLLKQNALDQETIDFINNQKEVTSELPEEEEDYDSVLGTIADIGKGVIGLAGANEELPDYETGEVYNEYIDDARKLKDQGLSAEEENYMTGKARNAFEFGMKQYRGAGSSSALVGAANQAAILQDQYGKIAAISQGVRRDNRKDFAKAAVVDEGIQRQKFQDKYNEVANSKKEGAALARDAYNNASERVQFEKQYGKDSQYSQLMNENILSMRQNKEYAKQAKANQKQMTIKKLQEQQLERTKKIG